MAAIATSSDGLYVFVALENSSGQPVVAKASYTDLSIWTAAYSPLSGTVANLLPNPGKPDEMIFYGHFGTNIQVIKHAITAATNINISPPSLGAQVANTLAINPSNPLEMVCTVNTAQDMYYTNDGGVTWSVWDAVLGFDPAALNILWSDIYFDHRVFVAGRVGAGNLDLIYSPNEMVSKQNKENAGLAAQANICSVETTDA